MKVEGKDVGSIVRQLEDAEKKNQRYVLMEKEMGTKAVQPDSLKFFREKQEANYAGFLANAVNGKNVDVLPVREVLNDMQRQMALHQIGTLDWSQQPNLFIDTGRVRTNEIVRQDIFTDEIARKLKEQHIQSDVKQLREYISRDQQQFTISGIGKENGKEKAYNINIEQDGNRAFHITGVALQQENERHKSVKIMQQEELLGGRLHREDAAGVKQMMQAQREAGNRFVAFENGQQKIKGQHFSGFENALKAVDFVHDKAANENKNYLFRSINTIEKEADWVLGNKQELAKEAVKQSQQELNEKRSRGSELTR